MNCNNVDLDLPYTRILLGLDLVTERTSCQNERMAYLERDLESCRLRLDTYSSKQDTSVIKCEDPCYLGLSTATTQFKIGCKQVKAREVRSNQPWLS